MSTDAINHILNYVADFIERQKPIVMMVAIISIVIVVMGALYYFDIFDMYKIIKNNQVMSLFVSGIITLLVFVHMNASRNFKLVSSKIDDKFIKWESSVKFIVHLSEMINPFNKSCIEEAKKIIFNGPKKTIYAIDWTPAGTWLSEDLLGYLAMQANWRAREQGREVHRIFVWDRIDHLERKMIAIHCMLGFHTYITNKEAVQNLLGKNGLARDVFFWDFPMETNGDIKDSEDIKAVAIPGIEITNSDADKIIGFCANIDKSSEMETREWRARRAEMGARDVMRPLFVEEAKEYAKIFNKIKCCGKTDRTECLTEYFDSNFLIDSKLDYFETKLAHIKEVWKNPQRRPRKTKEGAK